MPEVRIDAQPRTEFGKGAARRARREGRVPAVLYGHGAETRHVVLPGHDLMLALKTPNVLIRLEGVPGVDGLALPKAVQRDPIKGFIEHADLILVRRGEKVTVDIAVRVNGDIAPDGLLDQQVVQLSVEAEATNIPDGIDVDVTGMEVGSSIHAGDLTLPRGTSLQVDPETLIVHVLAAPTAEQMEAEIGGPEAAEPQVPEPVGGDRVRFVRRQRRRLTRQDDARSDVRPAMPEERWLIAGLGNPGPEYAGTRHNAGHMVADLLAERMGARFKAHRTRNDVADGRLAGMPVTLAKPRTYMNLSGGPVAAIAAFYKIPPERIVVIHDELDIPFGSVRLKFGGGDNGHNGLRSITQALGTNEYYRVRFGIGRPPGRMDAATYVLRDFAAAERKELPLLIDRCADAVETLLSKGLAVAQNTFHTD